MQMMQELEESRINFMKYNLEKFMRHISNFGKNIESQAKTVQEQTSFVSSDTDIKLFISENRSGISPPVEI